MGIIICLGGFQVGTEFRRTGLSGHVIRGILHPVGCTGPADFLHHGGQVGGHVGRHQAAISGGLIGLDGCIAAVCDGIDNVWLHQDPAVGNGAGQHVHMQGRHDRSTLADGNLDHALRAGILIQSHIAGLTGQVVGKLPVEHQLIQGRHKAAAVELLNADLGKGRVAGIREGFCQVHFSVGLPVIAFDGLPVISPAAFTVKGIAVDRVGILLQQFNSVHDLEGGTGRIASLGHTVEQDTGVFPFLLICVDKSVPVLLDVVGIIVRSGDHGQDLARGRIRDNDGRFLIAVIIQGLHDSVLQGGIQGRNDIVARIAFQTLVQFHLLGNGNACMEQVVLAGALYARAAQDRVADGMGIFPAIGIIAVGMAALFHGLRQNGPAVIGIDGASGDPFLLQRVSSVMLFVKQELPPVPGIPRGPCKHDCEQSHKNDRHKNDLPSGLSGIIGKISVPVFGIRYLHQYSSRYL